MGAWQQRNPAPKVGLAVLGALLATAGMAQPGGFGGRAGGPGGAPPSARDSSPVDLTGTWVSLVTEDWIERMSPASPPSGTAGSGGFGGRGGGAPGGAAPISSDDPCAAYGAGGIMRVPGRVRISWRDDQTLLMEFDAGSQRRMVYLDAADSAATGALSLQGTSTARWQGGGGGSGRGFGGGPASGFGAPTDGRGGAAETRWDSLEIETTDLSAGYLLTSRNWYADGATLTELIRPHSAFDEDYFTVTAIVQENGAITSMSSSSFRRESNDSGFSPTACEITP